MHMSGVKKYLIAVVAGIVLTIGLLTPAHASVSAQVSNSQIVVTISGKQPKKATLVLAGKSYKLKRSGTTWHTKTLPASVLASANGARAKIKAKIKGKTRTQKTTITTSGGGGDGSNGGNGGLFAAPGVDRSGQEALDAVLPYLGNSRMTDCGPGWPACAVEYRYAFASDGTIAYCRLQSVSGSDVKSYYDLVQFIGANQYADGSWGVSAKIQYRDGSNNPATMTVQVAADGNGRVLYWSPGADPNVDAPQVTDGLHWYRGYKDCDT